MECLTPIILPTKEAKDALSPGNVDQYKKQCETTFEKINPLNSELRDKLFENTELEEKKKTMEKIDRILRKNENNTYFDCWGS